VDGRVARFILWALGAGRDTPSQGPLCPVVLGLFAPPHLPPFLAPGDFKRMRWSTRQEAELPRRSQVESRLCEAGRGATPRSQVCVREKRPAQLVPRARRGSLEGPTSGGSWRGHSPSTSREQIARWLNPEDLLTCQRRGKSIVIGKVRPGPCGKFPREQPRIREERYYAVRAAEGK
jgi:hypothetical protein